MTPNLSAQPNTIDLGANHIIDDNDYQYLTLICFICDYLLFNPHILITATARKTKPHFLGWGLFERLSNDVCLAGRINGYRAHPHTAPRYLHGLPWAQCRKHLLQIPRQGRLY